jgi:hypothetical protein
VPRGRDRLLLLAVVLGWAGLALAVTDLHRYLAYDEAIYLSQVYPGPALAFTAPRARGLPLLLAPLGWVDAPLPVIRGYLLMVNAGLMYLGFGAWAPVLGRRAVLAAAGFGVGWLPLFYSTEAFPNLPVAFGAVAAGGFLAQSLNTRIVDAGSAGAGSRRPLPACAAAVALTAVVRPTEAGFIVAGLALAALTRDRRELGRRWGALAAGLVIGWLPWLIEAQVRFGGPLARLRAASANIGGGFHPGNLSHYLGFTDGPLSGRVRGGIPRLGELWWLVLLAGVLILLARWAPARRPPGGRAPGRWAPARRIDDGQQERDVVRQHAEDTRLRAGTVAAAAGLAVGAQYLFTPVLEARFLLPAYALLTVTLCAAVPGFRRPFVSFPAITAAAGLALFAVFTSWQLGVARRIEAEQVHDRLLAARLTDVIRRQDPPPCFVASDVAFPVIAFEAGCQGAIFRADRPANGLPADPPAYVLTRTDPAFTRTRPVPGSVRRLGAEGAPGWWLFIAADPGNVPSITSKR